MPRLRLGEKIAALPADLRWLLGGAALLAGILLGGAVTAYGGTLLVLLLWALCAGALRLLLRTTARLAFPEANPLRDKHFLCTLLAGGAAGVALIAAIVYTRQTIYGQDAINYYAKQNLLLNSFAANGFYGVHLLAENLLTADYKMFLNLFVSLPYLLTGRTINAFMICYAVTCFLPAWCALLLCAEKVARWFGTQSRWYLPLCMAVMVLWPMFLWPATNGMPDFFGLAFIGCILLLTADYRFETLPAPRLACLFGATFALVLTRRWYMFWIVGYYAVYALFVLAGAARRGCFARTLGNICKFGIPAVLGIVLPLILTFRTILSTDYSDIYGAYYGGGFLANCAEQLRTQGALWLLLCLYGLIRALLCGKARWPVLAVALSSLLAMALFTRTQSMGYHQALILAPAYLALLFCWLARWTLVGRPRGLWRWASTAVAVLAVGVNFAASLWTLPGGAAFTGVRIDLTRRTDLDQIAAVTDFVAENCDPEETVYININSDGYSGSSLAFSDPARPELQTMILYESSVPSTHGFPTGIWSSRYVMVTDRLEDDLIGRINTALRTDTPASAHYAYVTEFPLDGVTLYCYERTAPVDEAERAYFNQLFADYDAQWPAMFSEVINSWTE